MKNILSSLTTAEKRRITEMHVNATKKNYLSEEMCSANDEKPSSNRPLCSESGVSSGKITSFNNEMFLHYKDESNCPKLCKVNQKTTVTLS